MFYDGAGDLARVLIVGTLGYVALLAALRISGKRTLAQMNAFDFVVTVALGSTLATMLLSSEVSLVEGVLALALLIGLQYGIAWLSVHSRSVEKLVKSEPSMLVYRGRLLHDAMRHERVTEPEIMAALRQMNVADLSDALAVVMESNGSMSVLPYSSASDPAGNLGFTGNAEAWREQVGSAAESNRGPQSS